MENVLIFFAQFGQASPVFPCFPTFLTGLSCQALPLSRHQWVLGFPPKSSVPKNAQSQMLRAQKGRILIPQRLGLWPKSRTSEDGHVLGGLLWLLGKGILPPIKLLLLRALWGITIKVSVQWSSPPSHHPAATFLFIEPFPRTLLYPSLAEVLQEQHKLPFISVPCSVRKGAFFYVPLISFGKVLSLLVSFKIFFFSEGVNFEVINWTLEIKWWSPR